MTLYARSTSRPYVQTLSLPDALPICFGEDYELLAATPDPLGFPVIGRCEEGEGVALTLRDALSLLAAADHGEAERIGRDRKSTRLNSSHQIISYAVFCLKKKKKLKLR